MVVMTGDRRSAVRRTTRPLRPARCADLSVKRWERDINGDGVLLVGGIDRGSDLANDQAHQPNNRREKEIARVLPVGGLLEELINDSWAERVLHRGLSHERDVIALSKAVKTSVGIMVTYSMRST